MPRFCYKVSVEIDRPLNQKKIEGLRASVENAIFAFLKRYGGIRVTVQPLEGTMRLYRNGQPEPEVRER